MDPYVFITRGKNVSWELLTSVNMSPGGRLFENVYIYFGGYGMFVTGDSEINLEYRRVRNIPVSKIRKNLQRLEKNLGYDDGGSYALQQEVASSAMEAALQARVDAKNLPEAEWRLLADDPSPGNEAGSMTICKRQGDNWPANEVSE